MEQEKIRIKKSKRGINSASPIGGYNKSEKLRSLGNWEFRDFEVSQSEGQTQAKLNRHRSKPSEILVTKKIVQSKVIDRERKQRNSSVLTSSNITSYSNYVAYQVFFRPLANLDVKESCE